jgi:hypothetical protein
MQSNGGLTTAEIAAERPVISCSILIWNKYILTYDSMKSSVHNKL